jgi:arsenate reductase
MVPPGGIRGGRPRLGGRRATPPPEAAPIRKRVLFVCIGNSCRSQMAEGFARTYGADVMEARSAGISPAAAIAPLTRKVLSEKNISLEEQFPKALNGISGNSFDIIVNMSGSKLGVSAPHVVAWAVPDPIGQKEEVYQSVANQIEDLVMRLILELRSAPR